MEDNEINKMKTLFNMNLAELAKSSGCYYSKERYQDHIKKVKAIKIKRGPKTVSEFQKLQRYDVITENDSERLVYPAINRNQKMKHYVYTDELFDLIHKKHIAIGHGAKSKLLSELKKDIKNISIECIILYVNTCEICQINMEKRQKINQLKTKSKREQDPA